MGRLGTTLLAALLAAIVFVPALHAQSKAVTKMTKSEETIQAATAGDLAALGALLDADPSLADARDERGISAILRAVFAGQPKTAELIASRRSSLDVFEASALGREREVETVLAKDPAAARACGADGFTALHYAAHLGWEGIARALVTSGADVNAHSRNGLDVTPLQSAVAGRRLEIARFLLERGADAKARQEEGSTALHAAAFDGNADLVRLLLDHGADPMARQTADGKTPLDLAVERGHADVAEILRSRAR